MHQSQPFGLVFVLFVSCLHALLKDSTLGQYFMRFCFFIFTYMEKKSEFFFILIFSVLSALSQLGILLSSVSFFSNSICQKYDF